MSVANTDVLLDRRSQLQAEVTTLTKQIKSSLKERVYDLLALKDADQHVKLSDVQKILSYNDLDLDDRVRLVRGFYPIIYSIYATPSDQHHVPHTVSYFFTKAEAFDYLPEKRESYDYDERVTWSYDLRPVDTDDLNKHFFKDIGKIRKDYPY